VNLGTPEACLRKRLNLTPRTIPLWITPTNPFIKAKNGLSQRTSRGDIPLRQSYT
jgi:hypothetical protein